MNIVFDIGGSQTRVGISRGGKSLDQVSIKLTQPDWESGMRILEEVIDDLSGKEKVTGMVGGIAGVWDREKARLLKSPNLPNWVDKPIKERLQHKYQTPVVLENDAALGGLGEAVWGAGRGEKIVGYLAIGTGVGGARIVEGKIDHNAFGFEPGHQIVQSTPTVATLEQMVGGRSIDLRYGVDAAQLHDESAWREIISFLAAGIVNITLLWSPHMVVLGGSVSKAIPIVELKEEVAKRIVIFPWVPKIETSQLLDEAGLWGGLAMLNK